MLAIIIGAYKHTVSKEPAIWMLHPRTPGHHVNPFIGTGGFPGCAHNTGGVRRYLPDTASLFINHEAFNYCGYYYGDNKIIGFSNTRMPGAGGLKGGNLRVFPTTLDAAPAKRVEQPFARFSHEHEKAFPGYYGVWLPKNNILAELTATPRVALHRYTFRGGSTPSCFLRY